MIPDPLENLQGYALYRHIMDNKGGGGSYHHFTDRIPRDEINTIVELGSRDALDAIWLSYIFDAEAYAWECHPDLWLKMKENISHFDRVHMVDKAVWSEDTTLDFFPVTNGNVGASSCFEADNEVEGAPHLEQTKITVEAIRLDDWANKNNISNIDLLVMDLQGAEVEALKGAGDLLNNVKYIITEGCVQPFYQGAPHIDDITEVLENYGFSLVDDNMDTWQADELQGDFFFVRLAKQ